MPGEGGSEDEAWRQLDATRLTPGDIILTSDRSIVSRAIRAGTRSDISHAMIYVESHSIIDANNEGVHARNTQRLFFPSDCALYVLRPLAPLTPAEALEVCLFARSQIGTQYTKLEAAQAVLPLRRKGGRKQYCSRLVAQAYEAAGRGLVPNAAYASPGDLLRCRELAQLEDVTIPASGAHRDASGGPDLPQMMRDATNAVLGGARLIDPGIQTFDDLNAFLIREPRRDAAIASLYERSGYLDLWKFYVGQCPWHYDSALMAVAGKDRRALVEAYCLDTLRNGEGTERYRRNLAGYFRLHAAHGLKTFERMRQLYEQLHRLDVQRTDVARAWLAANAPHHFAGSESHTEAWFDALGLRNPEQAVHTRRIIELAGHSDVCSICGDDPASDMRLVEEGVTRELSWTMRLCADCRQIRGEAGEQFEPIDDSSH